MPELPEVESIIRSVKPFILGRQITGAEVRQPERGASSRGARLWILSTPAPDFRKGVCGAVVEDVRRYGKNIVLHLRRSTVAGNGGSPLTHLFIHLGMTGRLTCEATPEFKSKYTHLVLSLDAPGCWLHYSDIRQFGHWRLSDGLPQGIERLGPDPLEISFDDFFARLRTRRAMVKSLLLDQRFLRGIGNIYADESLFRARVHPAFHAAQLSRDRAQRLYDGIQETLRQAIELGGSSISNYVDAWGRPGLFQQVHQVYRRTGLPCFRCGARIRRILIASRSTHFCPRCQRAGRNRHRGTETRR
jgi:formamidopyrimidine-DNA glycosylase